MVDVKEAPAINELTDSMPGIYLVITESGSRHQIEIHGLGDVRICRTPPAFTINAIWQPSLYSDGETIPVVLVQLKVGLPGVLIFAKAERASSLPGYLFTERHTTVVETIERIGTGDDLR